MKKFKKGEKVIVGQFLDGDGGVYWNPKMKNFVGKRGTVEHRQQYVQLVIAM